MKRGRPLPKVKRKEEGHESWVRTDNFISHESTVHSVDVNYFMAALFFLLFNVYKKSWLL
jgi:hypothetical protein